MGGGSRIGNGNEDVLRMYDATAIDPGIIARMPSVEPPYAYTRTGERYGTKDSKKIYNKKELEKVVDALNRIGIRELALPPEGLGRRYAPINYVLPMYPPNTMPEDIRFAF